MAFEAKVGPLTIRIVDVMTFNDDGKFSAMVAYWGPFNMQSLSGDPAAAAEAAARSESFLRSLAT